MVIFLVFLTYVVGVVVGVWFDKRHRISNEPPYYMLAWPLMFPFAVVFLIGYGIKWCVDKLYEKI